MVSVFPVVPTKLPELELIDYLGSRPPTHHCTSQELQVFMQMTQNKMGKRFFKEKWRRAPKETASKSSRRTLPLASPTVPPKLHDKLQAQ